MEKIEQPDHILCKLAEFSRKPKGFLLLVGPNGTGKTFAAKKILSYQKYCDSDEYKCITQSDLNIEWKHQIKEWGDELYLINKYHNYKFLILDDLGTRIPTDAFGDYIYSIIDRRWNIQLPTIITSNLTSSLMRERFGDPIVSRISSGKIVKFEGEDRRISW